MEEINLKELFIYLKKNIAFIIFMTIIFGAVGGIYTFYYQIPKYRAETTLVLTHANDSDNNAAITASEVMFNRNLVSTYREIITSRSILKDVIEELELNYEYNELSNMINVSSVRDTELIEITVSSTKPREAKNIANSLSVIFGEKILDIFSIKNISVIDKAETPKSPYNIDPVRLIVMGSFFGLAWSLFYVILLFGFDNTLKDEEEIEKIIKLNILGIVPKLKGMK